MDSPKKIEKKSKVNFTKKMSIFFGKFQNQRHIASMNDTFATLVPILIVGSIGILFSSFIFGGSDTGKYSLAGLICHLNGYSWDDVSSLMTDKTSNWYKVSNVLSLIFQEIESATIGAISIYISFIFSYYLAKAKKSKEPFIVGIVSLLCFMFSIMGKVTIFIDVKGLFSALIVGTISTEFYIFIEKKVSINIIFSKADETDNRIINKSFKIIIPLCITLLLIGCLNLIFIIPATTFWKSLSIMQSDYGWNKTDLWTSAFKSFSNTGTRGSDIYEGFISFSKSYYGLSTGDVLVDEAQKNSLINILNNFNKTGTKPEEWFNNVNYFLTAKGKTIFVLYMFSTIDYSAQNGFNANSILDLSSLTINSNFWNNSDNVQQFFISISYNETIVSGETFGLTAGIYKILGSTFFFVSSSKSTLGIALFYVMLVSIFWFFGIHGSNVIASIFEPIWVVAGITNTNQYSVGRSMYYGSNSQISVFTKTFFDIYINIGGAGGTLALIVCILLFSKRKESRRIAKLSIAPSFMNVNEPIVFGVPIILNWVYFVPFVISPMISVLIAWAATGPLSLVKTPYVSIPWTMPWFLGAFLATQDIYAVLLSFIIFLVAILIWFPFVILDNYYFMKKLKVTNPEKYDEIVRISKDKEYREYKFNELKKEKLLRFEKMKKDLAEQKFQNRVKKLEKKNKRMINKMKHEIEMERYKKNKKISSEDEI